VNSLLKDALLCAIQTLKGNGADFSPHEKENAIEQLTILLAEKEKE
jgi:hypothetical protein